MPEPTNHSTFSDYELELKAANEAVYKHSLELARLKKQLELLNREQENLLHFISHEIKGYLTDGQGAFAGIVEGDYGDVSDSLRNLAQSGLSKMRTGVSVVMDILDASNIKKGTMTYRQDSVDLLAAVDAAVQELTPLAEEKRLMLSVTCDQSQSYRLVGDADKIKRHVVRNIIDNALRYTLQGFVQVTLSTTQNDIMLSIKDSGVGISDADREHLFTEGGHGKESIKINVHSTGYGLYIAKQIVEAHKGTIEARSEGAGKGSEFIVRLPMAPRA